MLSARDDRELAEIVAAAAHGAGLGDYRKTYFPVVPEGKRYRMGAFVTVVACWVLLLGMVAHAPVLVIIGATWTLLSGGWLACNLAVYGYVLVRSRGMRLDLYEYGLVAVFRRRARVGRYDSMRLKRSVVALVKDPVPNQITYAYSFADRTGRPVVLRHVIEHPEQWGEEIENAVTAAQLPLAEAALAAGERVEFEYFWMTAAQVGAGKKSVPWSEVDEIRVRDGKVSVRVAGGSRPLESLPSEMIPNFTVFRTLADRLRAAHRP